MSLRNAFLTLVTLLVCSGLASHAATISGTVKGPDGEVLKGVFVQAQDGKTHISFIGLSDNQGHYRLQKLPAGEYQVSARAAGYQGEPLAGVKLGAEQAVSFELSLHKSPVRWNELSIYQAGKLWPASPAKDKVFSTCFTCHGFQTRMATVRRNADEWLGRVQFMQGAMKFGLGDRLNDQEVGEIAAYLHSLYGEKSVLPESPQDAPGYKDTVRPVSNEALKISYVEYDMPQPSSMPFSAAPDKDGYFWIPEFGIANRIGRLDPKSGEFQEFTAPNAGTAAIHSAVPAADGTVWLTEQGSNKIGKWDPQTRKITEFQDAYLPGRLGYGAGSKHTLRFDGAGNVWSSGAPLTMLDRKTGKFTRFDSIPSVYDVKEDKDGNIWFTKPDTSSIGRVDVKTLKISVWTPPTPRSFPRRIDIDDDGIVWFGEYNAGKVGRFDPKTEKFTEYRLPGPEPTPYGFGIDAEHHIWYSSYTMDVIGRFDPKTGKTVEYPFPHSENTIREFFRDAQGRLWYGTPSNNKVGYIQLN
ncbi:MAG: carboxypeptidase regulatory-like domain-containing protein [Steroidobacterales bacterium]